MAVESRDPTSLVRRLVEAGRGEDALRLASEACRAGRAREAEALAQAALDAGYVDSRVYYLLAATARATGRPALAADMARVGIALDPDPTAARRDLAMLLLELGRPSQAAEVLEAIPPDRQDRTVLERLGLAFALSGRRVQARQVFRAILAAEPSDERARRALAALAPRPAGQVLDALARDLRGALAVLFARLRQGAATEAELQAALAGAGYGRTLVKALVRELAERTRQGELPLVRVVGDEVSLDLAVLDVELEPQRGAEAAAQAGRTGRARIARAESGGPERERAWAYLDGAARAETEGAGNAKPGDARAESKRAGSAELDEDARAGTGTTEPERAARAEGADA